jgi:hypothetical protein
LVLADNVRPGYIRTGGGIQGAGMVSEFLCGLERCNPGYLFPVSVDRAEGFSQPDRDVDQTIELDGKHEPNSKAACSPEEVCPDGQAASERGAGTKTRGVASIAHNRAQTRKNAQERARTRSADVCT